MLRDLHAPDQDGHNTFRCTVISIDAFGSCILNLQSTQLAASGCHFGDLLQVKIGNCDPNGLPLMNTFADVAVGSPLLIYGSSGRVEVALREASAAAEYDLKVGDIIEITTGG
jgi:S-adenosylmethionine hydrolase